MRLAIAPPATSSTAPEREDNTSLCDPPALRSLPQTYMDSLSNWRAEPLTFLPPRASLSAADARIWRRLQTITSNFIERHPLATPMIALTAPIPRTQRTISH
ncbi:hypothetical protein HPB48_013108 [Haemaphysalis longicornis]|uniref:Uncharacterized protein n=1 Tax=Haemaphysalis longicornis TaxID=44386 RepID=A0A9J6GX36_HAELO|nr:hypothetical protein HPB48_013108 [Haemaphysalis longicornis]